MGATPFLFGKLPAHGDFVARGLSDAEREAWDAWSTSALDALRAQAGDGFEDAHGAAPPWRFVTGGGDRWRAGALAPSVDGAGRRYLLAVGADGLSPAEAGAAGLAYADAAEAVIYEALGAGLNADAALQLAADRFADLAAATADAARALAAAPAGPGAWWTLGSPDFAPCALAAGRAPADLFARTAARVPEPVG